MIPRTSFTFLWTEKTVGVPPHDPFHIRAHTFSPAGPSVGSDWRDLAEKGDRTGQLSLGPKYAEGYGVKQDYQEAEKWYRLAADQGDPTAQANLGIMYMAGQGVPNDDGEAAKWFSLAAERGNSLAQNNLSFMYANGRGVTQSYVNAFVWWDIAAEQGVGVAKTSRDVVARPKMSAAEIATAEESIRHWKPTPS